MLFLLWVYGEESWRPKAGTSADIPKEKNYRLLLQLLPLQMWVSQKLSLKASEGSHWPEESELSSQAILKDVILHRVYKEREVHKNNMDLP